MHALVALGLVLQANPAQYIYHHREGATEVKAARIDAAAAAREEAMIEPEPTNLKCLRGHAEEEVCPSTVIP